MNHAPTTNPTAAKIDTNFTSPAVFIENQGQWADDSIRYALLGNGANVLHTDTGPVFQLVGGVSDGDCQESWHRRPAGEPHRRDACATEAIGSTTEPIGSTTEPIGSATESPPTSVVFSMRFDGAETIAPVGFDRAQTYFNFYVGEQDAWRSDVPAFETVAYPGLCNGIDLLTWARPSSLKYEFHVAPGSDYDQIRVQYEGIEGLSLDQDGALLVETTVGTLIDAAPYVYQIIAGEQVEVPSRFTLQGNNSYSFTIDDDYDHSAELVIDPELDWSTYLGGGDRESQNRIAVDAAGNALVSGGTGSLGWVSGGFYSSYNGGIIDVFVAKLSPSGDHLWSTYLGGSESDGGGGIAVGAAGSALVSGWTRSPGWISGGFDTSYNGRDDAFVAKLSASGDHLWSTYLGGSDREGGSRIAVDAAGNSLVAGSTSSPGWVSGGFDTSYNGGDWDAFVARLSSVESLRADLTGNGFVDFEDLTVLLAHWNQNVPTDEGNLVDPFRTPVNFEDLTVLLAAWTGPGPAASPGGHRLEAATAAEDVAGSDRMHLVQQHPMNRVTTSDGVETSSARDRFQRRGKPATYGRRGSALRRLQAGAVDRAMADDASSDDAVFTRRAGRDQRSRLYESPLFPPAGGFDAF